jgi:hypothetical protein
MSAIDYTSRAPRSSVTVQLSLQPMLPPRFQNGLRWHARQASSLNDSNTLAESPTPLWVKADIPQHRLDVRFVPKADILRCGKERRYSITSSARASNVGGMVMPSALAVLRLTMN